MVTSQTSSRMACSLKSRRRTSEQCGGSFNPSYRSIPFASCIRSRRRSGSSGWIWRVNRSGGGSRPNVGAGSTVFGELVAFPQLMQDPNFTLAVVLIQEEEVRIVDGKRRRWGKDWKRSERRLLDVVDQRLFLTPGDLLREIPDSVPTPFTTADLAALLSMPRSLSQKMAYCLRQMGAITTVGKKRNAIQYVFSGDNASAVAV